MQLGIILALPLSGFFAQMPLGWELVYYALAMLALSMAVIYGVLTASTPEKHEAIGDKEKEFLSEAQSCYSKVKLLKLIGEGFGQRHVWPLLSLSTIDSFAPKSYRTSRFPTSTPICLELTIQNASVCFMSYKKTSTFVQR